MLILHHREDEGCTTCRLCQQHFTTPRRLRVHVPQHFITTFCPCGEYSYYRDYILRHQRTMNCHTGHLYDTDETSFPTFLGLIKLFISDPVHYKRLSQRFPAPRAVTHGPIPNPQDTRSMHPPPPAHTVPRPQTLPRVVLQRIDAQPRKRSPSPVSSSTFQKQQWQSSSPSRHSSIARNLRKWSKRLTILNRRYID